MAKLTRRDLFALGVGGLAASHIAAPATSAAKVATNAKIIIIGAGAAGTALANRLVHRLAESLYFVNARFLEDLIQSRVTEGCSIDHVVLIFSAVNDVDYSALESLEAVNARLKDMGVGLHLSEVKGPVMDRLKRSHLIDDLNGQIYLSQNDAWTALVNGPSSDASLPNAPTHSDEL